LELLNRGAANSASQEQTASKEWFFSWAALSINRENKPEARDNHYLRGPSRLRDHRDRDDPVLSEHVAGHGVHVFRSGPLKGHTDDAARVGIRPRYLRLVRSPARRIAGHVEAPGASNVAAGAFSAPFELRELALVGERAVLPDVKYCERRARCDIKDVFRPALRTMPS